MSKETLVNIKLVYISKMPAMMALLDSMGKPNCIMEKDSRVVRFKKLVHFLC